MLNKKEIKGYVAPSNIFPDYPFTSKSEGKITFKMIEVESIYDAPAFFNPVMVLNRDMSILFSFIYSNILQIPIRIFEPLAGIGVRGLRLAVEIPDHVEEIVINDLSEISTGIGSYAINQYNLGEKVFQFKREARSLSYELAENKFKYHFIDLDPFGPPSPFIDSMWALTPLSSLISVTATDMQALCGVHPDACLRKYGGISLNNFHTHETATRLLIALVARSAARFERGIQPVFSANVDHYTKVLFITKKQKGAANKSVKQIGYSYTCNVCSQIRYIAGEFQTINCCNQLTEFAGPLWTGELFDEEWCQLAIDTLPQLKLASEKRLEKMLREGIGSQGLHGYYSMEVLGRNLKITQPKERDLEIAIKQKGYRFVKSRYTKQAFRSDISGLELNEVIFSLVS